MNESQSQLIIFLAGQTILLVWILSAVVQKQKDHERDIKDVKALATATAEKVGALQLAK